MWPGSASPACASADRHADRNAVLAFENTASAAPDPFRHGLSARADQRRRDARVAV